MRRRTRALLPLVAWGVLAAAVLVCATRFATTGDITYFLPEDADPADLAIARGLAESDLARAMVLLIERDPGVPVERAAAAAAALAERLRRDPGVAWIEHGPPPDLERALHATYFPARLGMIDDDPARLATRLTDDGLAETARALRATLAGPLGAAVARLAGADPFLAFSAHLRRLADGQPRAIEVIDDGFATRAGDPVLFLATVARPFDGDAQRALLGRIGAAFGAVAADAGGGLHLAMSGVNRLAAAAEAATRDDVARIGTLSLVGTALLFLLCFRSPRYLAVLFVPVGFGLAVGLATCLLVFGEVHGVTLAFGATLIGVSDDYTIHFLQHHVLRPAPDGPRGSLRAVWGGVLLGGVTTIVGFAGMGWTSTPGMRQIAVFGAAGIAAALLATYAVLPTLVPASPRGAAGLHAARRAMTALVGRIERGRRWLPLLPLAAVVLCVAAVPSLRWDDDPAALTTLDADLVAEDARVRGQVASSDVGRFVVVEAPAGEPEAALATSDRLYGALAAARAAGELDGFRSVHQVVWSAGLQRANLAALAAAPDLAARLDRAMAAAGFRPGAFAEFAAALAALGVGFDPGGGRSSRSVHSAGGVPVTLAALEAAGLGPLLRGLVVRAGTRTLVLAPLDGVRDPAALAARIAAVPGARYFDQRAYVAAAYGGFRTRVLQIVGVGLLLVLAVVVARYRRPRHALAAVLPAVLAAVTTLAILALAGVTLGLLHVLGLLWVLSTGVDYSVFVVEARRDGERHGDVGLALVGTAISCATTILAFGLLAMSSIPALRALGLVAAIGGALSFVLTPMAMTIVEGRR